MIEEFNLRSYLSSLKKYFSFSIILFIISTYLGSSSQGFFEPGLRELIQPMGEIVRKLIDKPILLLALIFFNNALKGFLNIALGVILGIYPVFFIAFNGFLVGYAAATLSSSEGLMVTVAGLLPHGSIEIPAVLLSSSIGLKIAVETFKKFYGAGNVKLEFEKGLRTYLRVILPLLLAAAFIEAFITPFLIQLVS